MQAIIQTAKIARHSLEGKKIKAIGFAHPGTRLLFNN